jgi:hypothetical protein
LNHRREDAPVELPQSEVSSPANTAVDTAVDTTTPDALDTHLVRDDIGPTSKRDELAALTRRHGSRRLAFIALGATVVSFLVGAYVLVHSTKNTPKRLEIRSTPAAVAPMITCRIAHAAERVSPRVYLPVMPLALDNLYDQRVAVGFAESANTAAGITVDPGDLNVQFPYRELQDKKILSVTPIQLGNVLSFVTAREGIPLSQVRALSDNNQFLFGVTPAGLGRQLAGQTPEILWPLETNNVITDPRIASASGLGHAVTFRQGGPTGTIQLGYLTKTGKSFRAPASIPTNVKLLGTPTLAVSPEAETSSANSPPSAIGSQTRTSTSYVPTKEPTSRTVLLAFAGRNTEDDPWTIFLGKSSYGTIPQTIRPFTLPAGGPGFDAMSPSVVGMPEGRWLIQWSEGQTGQRQIRAQILDANLRPLDKAHTVSPPNSNSGQGLLWSDGTRAVSFFVVSTGKQAELWAASLSCSK